MSSLLKRNKYLQHFRNAIQKGDFPIGTVAYYGPNDHLITKVVAGVLPDDKTNPILKKWYGNGIAEDPKTAAEIGEFFQVHQVQNVVMTEGIIGCPHEEGVDYPVGESCPECLFWNEEEV